MEILLQGEETGALVTYTPTSNLLNVTQATHALREIFHFDEKNEVPVVDIEAIPSPVNAPQPSINEEGGDTGTSLLIDCLDCLYSLLSLHPLIIIISPPYLPRGLI